MRSRSESCGFKDCRQTNLVNEVNISLWGYHSTAGTVLEEVTVSAGAVHAETESTQAGEVIGSTKMTTIPLNGRSYTDLFGLAGVL
jgi:hypothetical protein